MRGALGLASGCASTVSRDENLILSSEDSSCPDEAELELGLGLSLGPGRRGSGTRYAMTAKDMPSAELPLSPGSPSSPSASSSSTSSSCLSRANVAAGIKRAADSTAGSSGSGQVVGWPPIRAYRMSSMVGQAKSVATEESAKKTETSGFTSNGKNVELKNSMFVKVNMDGIPIGRKVDLIAHGCYESLAKALGEMFLKQARSPCSTHGLSDFVLTYEDKDGDWMLVGDVPWGMFLGSVKRLRIMRTANATGVAPESEGCRRRSLPA